MANEASGSAKPPIESTYDVSITGGKGAVVGPYATVFQYFSQAPDSLASLIRIREFGTLVEERTRSFVGRDYVFRTIDAAVADTTFRSGYIIIQGEPGIGKTALMSQLVKHHGWPHHFNIALQGIRTPRAFLLNICAQLIVRYKLNYPALPTEATQDGGFLSRLLSEAAEQESSTPLVVVVDALDEADDEGLTRGANRLFLPPTLPSGVYFVVSTREQYDYQLSVDAQKDIYVREDDPENKDDVQTYIRDFVQADREQMTIRISDWDISEDEFVNVITDKSEGNFMYLVHVLRDIHSGTLTATTIEDIERLPQGLKDYYRRHWNDMRSRDPEQFRRYQQPVVCLLATVREPVSEIQLLEWTGEFWRRHSWDPAALDPFQVKDVLTDWQEFLNADQTDGGEPRYRLYHASFQDFLKAEVGLAIYHETISETALAKIPGFLGPL